MFSAPAPPAHPLVIDIEQKVMAPRTIPTAHMEGYSDKTPKRQEPARCPISGNTQIYTHVLLCGMADAGSRLRDSALFLGSVCFLRAATIRSRRGTLFISLGCYTGCDVLSCADKSFTRKRDGRGDMELWVLSHMSLSRLCMLYHG